MRCSALTDDSREMRRRDAVRTHELLSLPDAGPCRCRVAPAGIALRACDGMSRSGPTGAGSHIFLGTMAVQRKFAPGDDRTCRARLPSVASLAREKSPRCRRLATVPLGPALAADLSAPVARARRASHHSLDSKPSPRSRFSPRSSSASGLGLIDPAMGHGRRFVRGRDGLTILGWRRWLVARAQFDGALGLRDHFAGRARRSRSERVPAVDSSAARGG